MTCFLCKGDMQPDTTTYFTEFESSMVIVKSVPCSKCDQCGEITYNIKVSSELARKVAHIKSTLNSELTITTYDVA